MESPEKKLSDEMYSFNANLSFFLALQKKEELSITRRQLFEWNEMIGGWIKRVRELER